MAVSLRILDDLAGKAICLKLPDDIRDVITCARYLQPFRGSDVPVFITASDTIVRLLMFAYENVRSYDPTENDMSEMVIYDICKLKYLIDGTCTIPYLNIPQDIADTAMKNLKSTDRVKVAICLEQSDRLIDSIMSGFTVGQLLNLDFYIFVHKDRHFNKELPNQVSHSYIYLADNIDMVAAMIGQMDIVLAEENVFAHLAGAMSKSIWLFASKIDDSGRSNAFLNSYEKVSVIHADEAGYLSAIRSVSLYLYFVFSDTFKPFSTNSKKHYNLDVDSIEEIVVDDINSISRLLDIRVPCLKNIQIETTSICNLRCEYCPNSTVGRDNAFMEAETYYKIIDSLKEYIPDYSGTLAPHFYGEPLIDKRLEQFIAYTRKILPSAVIEVYTNGELLTIDRYLALKTAGVDLFRISQHTELPSTVVETTLTYIQQNHPEIFSIDYKVYRDEKFKMNRGGLVTTEQVPLELMRTVTGCSMAHRVLTFDFKGNALLCCNDYLAQHVFGNIRSNSIEEIWEGMGYQRVRNLLMFGYLPFEMCKVCSGLKY